MDFPATRDSLVLQIRSAGNAAAWTQFSDLYRPVIYRLARRKGLQDADAQDLAQRVLLAVASAVGQWERLEPGVRFRHWLTRITHHAILNALTRTPRDRAAGGSWVQELLAAQPNPDSQSTALIEMEYRRELYLKAAERVQAEVEPSTWRAFVMTVVEQRPIEQAATALGKSAGVIYAARSRILARLRLAVRELEEQP